MDEIEVGRLYDLSEYEGPFQVTKVETDRIGGYLIGVGEPMYVSPRQLTPATRDDYPGFDWPVWLSEAPHSAGILGGDPLPERVRVVDLGRSFKFPHAVYVGSQKIDSFSIRSSADEYAEEIRAGLAEDGFTDGGGS